MRKCEGNNCRHECVERVKHETESFFKGASVTSVFWWKSAQPVLSTAYTAAIDSVVNVG